MAADDAGEVTEPALTAAKMVESFGFNLELADAVVLVYDATLMPTRGTTRAQRKANHPFRKVGSLHDEVDIVLTAGPGAPVAAITAEFLVAFGAQRVVAVGSAGYLTGRPGEPPPTHTVVDRAESDEGTSRHFGTDRSADPRLTAALLEHSDGPARTTVTTDVPFRHTSARLAEHRSRGDLVEMECAAFFSASRHFGLRAGALMVTSDVFDNNDVWQPLARQPVSDALHEAVRVATLALTSSP